MRPKSEIYTPKRDEEHPHPFHMGSSPPRGSARSSQMVLVPCLGIRGWGWRRRAEGLKQEERTSLHRIMRWDVKKNSWMLHAPTIDFRITMYIPYSEQRGQCPSTGNIENPPLPDFLLPCTNEVQLNRFWKPINNRSWGGGGGVERGCMPLLSPGIFRLFMVFCCEFHSNNILISCS